MGVICHTCNEAGCLLPSGGRIAIKGALRRHLIKDHQQVLESFEECNDVDMCRMSVERQMLDLARRHDLSTREEKTAEILMTNRFHPLEWVSTCTSCGSVKRKNDNHQSSRHKKGCITNKYDKAIEVQFHLVKQGLFIEKGKCSVFKFHRYYEQYRHKRKDSLPVASLPPCGEITTDGDQDKILAKSIRSVVPTKKFNTYDFHPSIIDGFVGGLSVGQESVPHHDRFYHQIEHHLMRGSCQPILAQFVSEHYEALVVKHFDGDWSLYADFFHKQLHEDRLHWEEKLFLAVKVMFGDQYSVLKQINPQFRTEIQTVGIYRPKSQMYSVVEKCRSYLRGMLAEETSEDDDGQPTHGDPMKMLVEDIVAIVDESESATSGIPKLLSTAGCEKTRDGYCRTMADYVVFLVRMYSNGFCGSDDLRRSVNGTINKIFMDGDAVSNVDQQCMIHGFAMQLLIGSLHLEQLQNYNSMMGTDTTMAELYCLGMAVKQQNFGESEVFFNFKGPATVHATASRLFYSLRIAACGACVHAARVGDMGLQNLLVGPKIFTNSSTWIAIARLQKSTKGYESKLEEGLEPAKHAVSSANVTIPDVFTITHPLRQSVVKITRTMFSNCVRACHKEITELTRGIINLLRHKSINTFDLNQQAHGTLDLADDAVYQAFEVSILSRLPQLRDPGSYKVIDVSSVVHEKKPGSIYSSTLSCLYTVTLDNGCDVEVESSEVARLLLEVLGEEANLRLLVDAHHKIAVVIGTLMTFCLRGSPRDSEILRFRCGITNRWFSRTMKCDLMGSNAPGSEIRDELLVRFNRLKYGGGGSGSSSLLRAPDVLCLGMTNYLSILRTGLILYMHKQETELTQLFDLTTGMFRRVELNDTGLTVSDWGRFSESIEDYFNSALGLRKGTFSLRMMRQIVAGVSQVLIDDTNRLRKAMSERTRINASNHQVATHKRYYQLGVRLDETRVSVADFDESRLQDEQTAEYMGCIKICRLETTKNTTDRLWRRLRLADDSIAFGCLKFGADINYRSRVPIQKHMFIESTSSCRDSLFNYPCGSGKTALTYLLCIYSYACRYSRECSDCESAIQLLSKRLSSRSKLPLAQNSVLAKVILADKDVVRFLDYCKKDNRPPPTRIINLVLVPYANTVRGVINEINKKQLVRAVDYDAQRLMECINDTERDGPFVGFFDFDVMVCTVSRAVMEVNASVIERAMMAGIIGCQILDEVHVVITNCEWMTDMNLIRTMRRHGVPLLSMTGTLQKGLEFELAQALMCDVGIVNQSHLVATRTINIYNGINLETRIRNRAMIEFRKQKGFYRSPCTLPTHIAIAFEEANGSEIAMCREAVNTMFLAGEKNRLFVAESVLIICATRAQADKCYQVACSHVKSGLGVSLLKGKESPSEVEKFHNDFTQGVAYGGIVTSVGAQSLDKKNLNMVIILSLCYSSDLLAQAIARSGRNMQQSLVLYIHHETLTQTIRKNYSETPFQHLEASTGGLDCTMIEKCLSPNSLTEFLYCKGNECYWEKLRETIDDEMDHSDHKDIDWCCSNCVSSIHKYVKTIWMPGMKPVRRLIPTHVSTGLNNNSSSAQNKNTSAAKRMADDMAQDCAHMESRTHVSAGEQRPSRVILPINYSSNHSVFVDRVRSFVTCQDSYNKLKQNCIWHIGLHLHKPNDSKIWHSTSCRGHYCRFIGINGTTSCFKCGGKTSHCGGGALCRLKKFEFVPFSRATSVCLQCGVFHAVGVRHQKTNCPSDRIYGMIIWALRSERGYTATREHWTKRCQKQLGIEFPKRVPFQLVTQGMQTLWRLSLEFVVSKESLNYEFWSCVVLALKSEGLLPRLC